MLVLQLPSDFVKLFNSYLAMASYKYGPFAADRKRRRGESEAQKQRSGGSVSQKYHRRPSTAKSSQKNYWSLETDDRSLKGSDSDDEEMLQLLSSLDNGSQTESEEVIDQQDNKNYSFVP